MIVLNTIFPLFALLFTGTLLRRSGLIGEDFLRTADRLVYYFFFPVMLFWKIGGAHPGSGVSGGLCMAAVGALLLIFGLTLAVIQWRKIPVFQAGAFAQAGFRFNTYIGMALILHVLGAEGVRHFGVLVGIVIPLLNVLSVSVLIWYSGRDMNVREKVGFFVKALVSNPLIIACALGLIYSHRGWGIPVFVNNTFALMSSITLPLALLSIGGNLKFDGIGEYGPALFWSTLLKLVLLPLVGYLFLKGFQVGGIPFKVGMIFFCLPTSTAMYVLCGQLNSDTRLASVAIMVSTLASFVSLSVALLL
ncbi:MAG: AEC family transporter [Desulfobacterales bacterium]|nr:AEC family transporter [Desulfobacterales bacterium]